MSELNRVVSAVQVKVDEFTLAIVSGSLSYKTGKPTREVKGTDSIGEVVYSENFEEAVGMVKFEVYATTGNLKDVTTIEGRQGSSVKFYDENGFERVMKAGVTKNDSERTLGTDGKITLDFMGTPID